MHLIDSCLVVILLCYITQVSLELRQAVVEYNSELIRIEQIKDAIEDMGFIAVVQPNGILKNTAAAQPCKTDDLISFADDFGVKSSGSFPKRTSVKHQVSTENEMSHVVIGVTGMHCKSCVRKIEDNMKGVKGIHSITVSLAESSAQIYFDDSKITLDSLAKKIASLNFSATLPNGKVYSPPSEVTDISIPPPVAVVPSAGSSKTHPTPGAKTSSSKPRVSPQSNTKQSHETSVESKKSKEVLISMESDVERCFIAITGMTCASCVGNIERNIGKTVNWFKTRINLYLTIKQTFLEILLF